MPKENTHLLFAHDVVEKIDDLEIRDILSGNMDYLYLGAVIPDAFLFCRDKEKEKFSEIIHGSSGDINMTLIACLLDEAKKEKRPQDFAFISGLLTHFALDIVFHPVIFALTGDMNEKDAKKREEINFRHQYWETYLDKKVNDEYFVKDLVKVDCAKNIPVLKTLCQYLGISDREVIKTFKRQYFVNSILGSRKIFFVAILINKLGIIVEKNHIALLKMNLKSFKEIKEEHQTIPDIIEYFDKTNSGEKQTTILEMFQEADKLAKKMIDAAVRYLREKDNQKYSLI